MMPSSSPTAGAHAIAAATVAGPGRSGVDVPAVRGDEDDAPAASATGSEAVSPACGEAVSPACGESGGTGPRNGIRVSSVTDSRRPVHLMWKEPIGRSPKD